MVFELINQGPYCFDQNDHLRVNADRLCVGTLSAGKRDPMYGLAQTTSARRSIKGPQLVNFQQGA